MEGQLSETDTGKKSLLFDGYSYRVDRVLANGDISWRCSNNRSNCKARIRTESSGTMFVSSMTEYNHPSDRKKSGDSKAKSASET